MQLIPTEQPRKLRLKFVITSMPVGGAEVLLLNLIRHLDKTAFSAEVICLKEPGVLGMELAHEIPVYGKLLASKWDLSIAFRLASLFRKSPTDAVITVGAGDKMFWGRLAAKLAGVPVICSALHSTGWPDGVGRLNRMLTKITDAFIACAQQHAEYLAFNEGFPASRVFKIPNGVDTNRFRPNHTQRGWLREQLGVPLDAKLVGIVAALRPEKNHAQFVEAGRQLLREHPTTHFVIVGDGPMRSEIADLVSTHGLSTHFHLLGNRRDTERIYAALDVFCLTSKNEANPVSILEALSSGVPVVAPDVGSISEAVQPGRTGFLSKPLSFESTADGLAQLLGNPQSAHSMGFAGRQLVRDIASLEVMVGGYEHLVESLYNAKAAAAGKPAWERPAESELKASRSRGLTIAPVNLVTPVSSGIHC